VRAYNYLVIYIYIYRRKSKRGRAERNWDETEAGEDWSGEVSVSTKTIAGLRRDQVHGPGGEASFVEFAVVVSTY
jgi:hypothetical protein